MNKSQRVPIDGLLLCALNGVGTIFVGTDQLDGETDLKVREPIRFTQQLMENQPINIFSEQFCVNVEPPNDKIYEFKGNFFTKNGITETLQVENAIWADMKIVHDEVYLLTIYTGKETRTNLKAKKSENKIGKTDEEINFIFKVIFLILIFISLFLFFLFGNIYTSRFLIEIIRIFIILNALLPFMLKMNLDFSKLFYCYTINRDASIEGTIVRNSQIPEELGRVEYLLSDKTGTLTKNEMVFKTLCTFEKNFGINDFDELSHRLKSIYSKNPQFLTQNDNMLKDNLMALILCNNVTPTFKDTERNLQGASPDEISLANFAEKLGFYLESRRTNSIKVINPKGDVENYEILENFAFTSERKRMGILVRNVETDEHTFYLKGADSAILKVLQNSQEFIFVQENCESLSKEGLRTLVLSKKVIEKKDYLTWKAKFKIASQDLQNRVEKQRKMIEKLEEKMTLIGVTAVEDLLQDDVKICISAIRNAGIKIWMLTGDKLETAKCIAISTGFKSPTQSFYDIIGKTENEILSSLELFQPENSVLVVSGDTLDVILDIPLLCDEFFEKAVLAKSVVLCRCAPQVKAEIALRLKRDLKKVVCCIGDGGNDTMMIKEACVGIGIEGKEGLQASLVSDFSIRQFKHILTLFLWHGRLSYNRTTTITKLVIHRGFIMSTIQYLYMIVFHFNSISIYNGYLTMFYGTIFTNFLVISLVFDEDIPKQQAFNYPLLYKYIQEGGDLTMKMFLLWVFKGIYQGATIILLFVLFFQEEFFEIVTVTFTSLILIEYLTVMLVIRNWHIMICFGMAFSFFCYLICLLIFPHYFLLEELSISNNIKIVFLVACGWSPIFIIAWIKKKFFPSRIDKIVKEARIQKFRKSLMRN